MRVEWRGCCGRKDLLASMLPKYRELLKYDLSILVFSGDVDAVVPVSLSWQQSMLYTVIKPLVFLRSLCGTLDGALRDRRHLQNIASVGPRDCRVSWSEGQKLSHARTSIVTAAGPVDNTVTEGSDNSSEIMWQARECRPLG